MPRHLLSTDDTVTATQTPPELRPTEVTWREDAPVGKLDLSVAVDFRRRSGLLSPAHRDRLLTCATAMSFPAGARIFEKGTKADKFWIICTGRVTLHAGVPVRKAATIDALGSGQ
ncbi:hypothetical protein [Streptomyces canus]